MILFTISSTPLFFYARWAPHIYGAHERNERRSFLAQEPKTSQVSLGNLLYRHRQTGNHDYPSNERCLNWWLLINEYYSFLSHFCPCRYAHLFSQLTYEQMLNLNEEQLENQGVTKGSQLH